MAIIRTDNFVPPADAVRIDLPHISDVCGAWEAQAAEELGMKNWEVLLRSLDLLLNKITHMAAEEAGAKHVSLIQLGIGASLTRRVVDQLIANKGAMYIQPVTRQ